MDAIFRVQFLKYFSPTIIPHNHFIGQNLTAFYFQDKSAYQREREAKKAAERQRSGNPQ